MSKPLVGIVMGSDSDLPIMKEAAKILDQFNVGYEVIISSAHRVPERTMEFARNAEANGIEVIIAAAGLAAHLPGVIAACTPLPVIGVPIQSGALAGVDALYAIVQMPSGIPVATVAINGAKNAGILAAQMLSIKYPEIRQSLKDFKAKMAEEVTAKGDKLNRLGIEGYLAQ